MAARVPWTAQIGIAFILTALALQIGWTCWMKTRTWVPLEVPVSLSLGQIRTGEFKINLAGDYSIEVEAGSGLNDYYDDPCGWGPAAGECMSTPSVNKASWVLSESGKVVAQGTNDDYHGLRGWTTTTGRILGGFKAKEGEHYVLTVDILKDGSFLNSANPRLRIDGRWNYPQYRSLDEGVPVVFLLFVIVGSILFIRSIIAHRESRYWKTISVAQPGPQSGVLYLDSDSRASNPPRPPVTRKGLHLTAAAWLGIGCIALGVPAYAFAQYWMATHTFVADVTTLSHEDVSLLLWLSAMCAAVGISLVVLFSITRLSGRSTRAASLSLAERAGQHFQWARKLPLRKTFSGPPSFGLVAVIALFLVVTPMWLLESWHRMPVGLNVHLLKSGASPMSRDFGSEPVVLRFKVNRREYTAPP
ncbi:MAG: hypothetical protein LAP21_25570, partial [Acidobacteriia bacterium]|nr:hypothetical protein [Terriglobia bacterium]